MARQLDNSAIRFSTPQRSLSMAAWCVGVAVSLSAGLIWSIAVRTWGFAILFVISLIGLAVFWYLTSRVTRQLVAARDESRIEWGSALPEIQRESLNIEVIELSRILEVSSEQMSDLQSAYIVAEDLALRQIQQEEQVPLLRHVCIGEVPFDAVFVKQDVIVCAEVSFLVAPDVRQERVESMVLKAGRMKKVFEEMNVALRPRLMIVLVTQLTVEDEERLRKSLNTKRFAQTPVDVEIRLLDFEALQRIYVTD